MANMTRKQRMNFMQEEQEQTLVKNQTKANDLWKEVNKANSKLMKDVAENFASGITAPSNPEIDIIASYAGQKNRSRITRTRTDEEGQLIVPEEYRRG